MCTNLRLHDVNNVSHQVQCDVDVLSVDPTPAAVSTTSEHHCSHCPQLAPLLAIALTTDSPPCHLDG